MRISPLIGRALAVLIVWLMLAWFVGTWLHMHGTNLWLLRAGLALLGLAGFVGYLWLRSGTELASGSGGAAGDEIDLLVHEADSRLQASNLGSRVKVSNLPAIFLLGDSGSAKTTTVLHSAIEPELLSGQAFQGDAVVPTRSLNVWLARQWLFIDPAAGLLSDPASRQRLVRRIAPLRMASVLGGAPQAPRAALVCIDSESLLAPGAGEAMTARARQLREALGEIAHLLGIRLPVYVLFTKMDRLAHFFEYAGNLTEEESAQVFGVTLPLGSDTSTGVYAERETRRLSEVFSSLTFSLSDHRPDLLAREHDAPKLPSIYEFPREFRKMRATLVQFLVDLCRPSQLRANPFLRGFYFTGVRPVTISDIAPAPAAQPAARAFDADATHVFSSQASHASPEAHLQTPGIRRVPQWVFLSHLFSDVILRDHAALGSSGANVKLGFWRRALLISAGALALLLATLWTVSFAGNHALKSAAVGAARAAQNQDVALGQLASSDSLRRLEDLRKSLAQVTEYQRDGRPTRLGWGLYIGDELYDRLYRIYFGLFRRILLAPTQENLAALLSRPSADRTYIYNALKAYLITTDHHEKSTTDFLPPVLKIHWQHGKPIDPDQSTLSAKQFLFYSEELRLKNPYANSSVTDDTAVQTSRAFLKQSATIEPIYQAMLAQANSQNRGLVFNRDYPGTGDVVVNSYLVSGAFTKPGWAYMQNAIKNPKEYFSGEAWVLGPDAYANLDPTKIQQLLQTRYRTDFLRIWREFLHATRVVGYVSIPDASNKLSKLSGNQSPLLSLLCVVSDNTAVDAKEVSEQFQPPQQVVPAGCHDRLAASSNEAYMQGLIRLQGSLQQLVSSPANDAFRSDAMTNATAADGQVRTLARNFPIDKDGAVDSTTQALLESPIRYVQNLIEGVPKEQANGAARSFCGQFNALMRKYPFQSNSPAEANLQDISVMFKPNDGTLWKFYQTTLQKFVDVQGSSYVPKQGITPTATPQFARFFSQAAEISAAFFPGNAQQPELSFSVGLRPTDDVLGATLSIGAQTVLYNGASGAMQKFTWPSSPQEVKLVVKFTGGSEFGFPGASGPWAAFHFFSHFEHWQASGSSYTMEQTLRVASEAVTVPKSGRPAAVSLTTDSAILKPGYFSMMNCALPAVR